MSALKIYLTKSQSVSICYSHADEITATQLAIDCHVGAQTAYITPGSPWENEYIESFNARLRDELLNGKSSIHSKKLKSSLNNGASTIIQSAHILRWHTNYQPPKPSSTCMKA